CYDIRDLAANESERKSGVAVGFGPVLAGIFCNMTDSWLPMLIMLGLFSCIGVISAVLMPEVRVRDMSLPVVAAEATAAD
ncbi:hypothetical protein QLF84_23360, partial [Salmonella enterica subsp. enterica serovar Oslo]|nr:hypothetical protein [Salmonella enterica subsp. enterica serovar Oslo]